MPRHYLVATAILLSLPLAEATAQGTFGARNVGNGVSGSTGRSAGLSQTGQVQSDAAVQRTQQAFVGSSSQSMGGGGLRSLQGGTGTRGLGGGLGTTGLGGIGGLGVGGLGGVGGIGGLGYGGMGMGGLGMGGLGMNGLNRGLNTMNNLNQFGAQAGMNGTQQNRQIRTSIRIGPSPNMPVMGARVQSFQNRLERIPSITGSQQVEVRMDGPVAVLRGVVATPRDRELIGRLALLEPGVRDIRNELVVDPSLER